mgnify:CR=1 FL=1
MNECLYFTNRAIGEGFAVAWVYRKPCPKCKKDRMGKPIKKNGKPDKKAPDYECPSCKYREDNAVVEKDLKMEIEFQCPHCKKEGEATTEYQRKTFEGVPAFIFTCPKCNQKIGITKKLKAPKKKKPGKAAVAQEAADDADDDE